MKKVLLLAANDNLMHFDVNILSARGIKLFTAANQGEAIEIHSREKMDLIICGRKMSGKECAELCKIFRRDKQLRNVSVITVLKENHRDDIEECMRAGVNECIFDPIEPAELAKRMARYLNIAKRYQARFYVRLRVEGQVNRLSFAGYTIDVSKSGFLFETDREFPVGKIVDFSMIIMETGKSINLKGEIVRKGLSSSPLVFLYGVRIDSVEEHDGNELERYISEKPPKE